MVLDGAHGFQTEADDKTDGVFFRFYYHLLVLFFCSERCSGNKQPNKQPNQTAKREM